MRSVKLDRFGIEIGNDAPFVFIGGPCVIENESKSLEVAATISAICRRLGIGFIFKSSYDKANRTSVESFRGVGLEAGLRILERVREEVGAPVLSDAHTVEEARAAGEVLDVLQIPAFLCRQTDLLRAAGATGKIVNVKKGQFMAPQNMKEALDKVGSDKTLLTERGTSFGYNALVVDMGATSIMKKFGAPLIFDAGHSVQLPGAAGSASGGKRELIPFLARAQISLGIAGIFLETDPDPDRAPCDGPNMWPTGELEKLLKSLQRFDRLAKEDRL